MTEAKVEVMEFVHFLNDPSRIKDLGGKVPKVRFSVSPPHLTHIQRARSLLVHPEQARLSWQRQWLAKQMSPSLPYQARILSKCSLVSTAARHIRVNSPMIIVRGWAVACPRPV